MLSIVSHIDVTVKSNIVTDTGAVAPDSPKWRDKKRQSVIIARKLHKAGLHKRSEAVMACGNIIKYVLCPDCGRYRVVKASLCHDRLCPVCIWRRAINRCATVQSALDYLISEYDGYNYYLMTLTCLNCEPSELSKAVKDMNEAWAKLRRRSCFKCIDGWARSFECTYNEHKHTLHPHHHYLLMSRKSLNESELEDIIRNWMELCPRPTDRKAQNVHTFVADSADTDDTKKFCEKVLECFKYTQKYEDLDNMPVGEFRLYASQIAHVRAVAYGGIIKQAIAYLGMSEEDKEDEPEETSICYNCKSSRLLRLIARWSFGEEQYKVIDQYTANDAV